MHGADLAVARERAVAPAEGVSLMPLLRRIWRNKLVVLGVTLVALTLGVLYARSAPIRYQAELGVVPASIGTRSGGGGSGGLSALTTFASLTSANTVSAFDLYLTALTSREIAVELAADQALMRELFAAEWDAERRRWREPSSFSLSLRRSLSNLFGLERAPWRRPDAARLRQFLESKIEVSRGTAGRPVTVIAFRWTDAEVGADVLTRIHRAADGKVRRADLRKTREYIRYLTFKLATVQLAEQRVAIADILADQERQAMTASSGLSYAAEVVEPAVPPSTPAGSGPLTMVIIAAAAGLILGCLVALMLPVRPERLDPAF